MAGITATYYDEGGGPTYISQFKTERWTLTNGAPTIAAGTGAASASGGTATINAAATDAAGQVVITTGTTIAGGGGTLAVVTFANTLAGTPSPLLFAAGANAAAAIAGTASPWVTATTTSFAIMAGSLTALTAYTFNYVVPDAKVNLAITTQWVQGSDTFATSEGASIASQSFTTGTATIGIRPNFTAGAVRLWSRF